MRALRARLLSLLVFASASAACIGTTGSELVTFQAYAAGPADLPADVSSRGLSFVNGRGWSITLRRAKLHIGALYLNRSVPVSGGQERECFLPGVYVAQVLSGRDVDALSPALQLFPELGSGTADRAAMGEVWLTGGSVDAVDDRTHIVEVEGAAVRGETSLRFEGIVTIGRNRKKETDPSRPGGSPLCAERIVSQIPVSITPTNGGSLVVRVDPREWFKNVELADLEPVSPATDLRLIPDESTGAGYTLYVALRTGDSGPYRFEWNP